MELREFGPDDEASITAYVAMAEASRLADMPWWPALTPFGLRMQVEHGWDGEPGRHFVVRDDGVDVGTLALSVSTYDNLDQGHVELAVHPDHRRRGLGRRGFDLACEELRAMGRSKVGWFGWDGAQTKGFAAALGVEPKAFAVCRRQHLHELEPGLAERLYAEAEPHARDYELVRIAGPLPDEVEAAYLEATAAINDAPLDGLELEDEVFSSERNRAFERAKAASGDRIYRIGARHRETGEFAGVTSVVVDGEAGDYGHQLDTSVVRAHRGHRLGLLLKSDMLRWLADAEPRLESLITFNAESNTHMVAVNERLGYRVMDRELQFQDRI